MRWIEGRGRQRRKPTILITFNRGKWSLSDCESMPMCQFLPQTARERDRDGATNLNASQECFWEPTHNHSKKKHPINYQHSVDLNEPHITHINMDWKCMKMTKLIFLQLLRSLSHCYRVALLEERQLPSVKPTVTVCSCLMTACRPSLSGGE